MCRETFRKCLVKEDSSILKTTTFFKSFALLKKTGLYSISIWENTIQIKFHGPKPFYIYIFENKVNESRGEIMVYLFHDTRTRSDGIHQLWS